MLVDINRIRAGLVLLALGLAGCNGAPNAGLPIPPIPGRPNPMITAQPDANNGRIVTLRADISDYPDARTLNWDFGDGSTITNLFANTGTALTHTFLASGTFTVEISLFNNVRQRIATGKLELVVTGSDTTPPAPPVLQRVRLKTNMGDILLEMRPENAPKSVANFLQYVEDGAYNNIVFHRVVPDFVVQSGGFKSLGESADPRLEELPTRDPVQSEANNGLSNLRGTVGVALRGNDANSGTDQFFINLTDNSYLDTAQSNHPAFTVFAVVVEGMDVADQIANVPSGSVNVRIQGGSIQQFQDVPINDVTIFTATRE